MAATVPQTKKVIAKAVDTFTIGERKSIPGETLREIVLGTPQNVELRDGSSTFKKVLPGDYDKALAALTGANGPLQIYDSGEIGYLNK